MNPATPGPGSPIALISPDGVSTVRGGGLPRVGSRQMPFTTIAPSAERSTSSAYSGP